MVLHLGLVGYGPWGKKIERTLLSHFDVSVISISKGEGPPATLDGVLIATQSAHHAQAALPFIKAGIPTFIEKPMATTVSDAERIRDAAKRSGAVVFVGHIFLYHPAFQLTLQLLPSMGGIRYVLCEGMNNKPRMDSSVLWDWLPHYLSMASSVLARDPDNVSAWTLSGSSETQAASAKYQYGNTPVVSTVSWLSPIPRMQMTIVCEDGTLVFNDKAERQLAVYNGRGEVSNPAYSAELPLTREMTAFLHALTSGDADPSHVEMGVSIVRAIFAAQESLDRGGQIIEI